MADISGLYDENAEPSTGRVDRELLPDGEYSLQLIESSRPDTCGGAGYGMQFKAEVTEGPHKDTWIFGFINLKHTTEKTQKIGQAEFAALRHATGVLSLNDTDELHYKEFRAVVGTQPGNTDKNGKQWPPKNFIKKYIFAGAAEVPASKAPPVSNDNTAVANDNPKPAGRTPWAKRAA